MEKYSDDIKIWSNISAFTLERDRSAAPCATKSFRQRSVLIVHRKIHMEKAFRMFHMLQTVLWFRRSEDTHGNSYWRETSQLSFVLQKLPSAQQPASTHAVPSEQAAGRRCCGLLELIWSLFLKRRTRGELDDMEGVCGVSAHRSNQQCF